MKPNVQGHLLALFSVLVWGTTFISTKVLLTLFTPIEILFFRFILGYFALWLLAPRVLRLTAPKQERYFIGAGLCGVTLYFLFENIALTYSLASSVGVIVAVSPFFTALLSRIFLRGEPLAPRFFLGFAAAMAGILLISWNGSAVFHLNPTGDLLAVLAALVWAAYSIFTRKIASFGYSTVQSTRRIFLFGLIGMIPALFLLDFQFAPARFLQPFAALNLLYLGLGASALCFVTWNRALGLLGAVKTSVYIYLVPVISVICSALILQERMTPITLLGTALTLAGLFISEKRTAMPAKPLSE